MTVVTIAIRINKDGSEQIAGVYTSLKMIPKSILEDSGYWFQNVQTNTEIHI